MNMYCQFLDYYDPASDLVIWGELLGYVPVHYSVGFY